VTFYSSPEEEAGALRRAAIRVGARLEGVRVNGRRVVGRVVCRDGWHAAELLTALAAEDAKTDGACRLAEEIRELAAGDPDWFAIRIMAFVKGHVAFVRDRGEVFSSPGYSLEVGQGDCEDHARLVYALAVAGGLGARLAFLHKGGGPTHAVAQVQTSPEGPWLWAETTVDAGIGEHPIVAARRLGIVADRGDITEGVRVMSESDLRSPPPGYLATNDAGQVERDAEVLRALGYLAADPEAQDRAVGDPTDPVFRRAVLAFQRHAGIVDDGLIGPQTRRALAGALPSDAAIGYLGEMAAGVVKFTSWLSDGFFRDLETMAADFRAKGADVSAEQFLGMLFYESGLRPNIRNRAGAPQYGLNQMGIPEMLSVGWVDGPDAWMQLTAHQQLPYVRRFYETRVKSGLGGDWTKLVGIPVIYALNLAPAYASRAAADIDAPIARKGGPGYEATIYAGNANLDTDHNDQITGRDLKRAVAIAQQSDKSGIWIEARRRLYEVGGTTPDPIEQGTPIAGAVAFVLAAGGLATWVVASS
jgi:hypothetical protein